MTPLRRLTLATGMLVAFVMVFVSIQSLRTQPSYTAGPQPAAPSNDPGPVDSAGGSAPWSPPRAEQAGSGLHYTPEEVAIWRERSAHGPYRRAGDAGAHTPGDWERIASNAARFLEDPADGRWRGPDAEGCVQADHDEAPPTTGPSRLRDAAFYYLIEQDDTYRQAVRDELLAQSAERGVDFTQTDRWCTGVLKDINPAPPMAHWLTKLLFAYDYIGRDAFSKDEREQLDDWFLHAANFFQSDISAALNDNFVDRRGGEYALTDERVENPGCHATAYYGSQPVCAVARYYNNRRAAQVRFVGLVGIYLQEPSMRGTAERFVREFIMFSMYPEGHFGEFERWRRDLPDLGWAYANNTVGAVITIADHMARAGDPSLYEYSTSDGLQGTAGGRKSIRSAIHVLGRYVDGNYERYATDDEGDVGDAGFLIDGSHEDADWHSLHDIAVTPANVYYRDEYIRGMYTRTAEGMPPYPSEPAPNGEHDVWSGESGIYPGVLFMFGQMEGRVNPYP